MRSPGINAEGELRGQPANPGSPGKMAVKMVCVCVCVCVRVCPLFVLCYFLHVADMYELQFYTFIFAILFHLCILCYQISYNTHSRYTKFEM